MSAMLPIVKHAEVIGRGLCSPPIFRMSCSLPRLWMIKPAHINNMALKNACMQMCRKAKSGWFRPMVTIMRPSWLVVE